ncbi:MAG TPA: AAA family ATPase [Steroidobacteraceae bacterium]|nr:AAA family ATPase [Steroidobacteraceae bacterium]
MYLELFQLRELPFRLSPDPQFLFLSRQHARAKAYMESTVWFTDGFVVITGEIGSGKTTLIEAFLREVPRDTMVIQISQTQVSVTDFLQAALVQVGLAPFRMKKAELIANLNHFIVEQSAAGRKVLMVIDEAQNLSLRVLEEIRLLSGVESGKDRVLRIILAGQPELNSKLDAPELVQLMQRVRLRFHLGTLDADEMRDYIRHRLDVAGAEGREIFAADTYESIHRTTAGVPRLINTLCDTAMLAAFAEGRDHVTALDLAAAIHELGWDLRPPAQVRAAQGAAGAPNAATAAAGAVPTLPSPGPPDASLIAQLVISAEDSLAREIPLRPGRILIGRTPENDVQIDSHFVSRHHCQITTTVHGSVIEDLNSTNGLRVRGRRVRRHEFIDGDVVAIGQHELRYVDMRFGHRHEAAPPAPPPETTGSTLLHQAPAHPSPQGQPPPAHPPHLSGSVPAIVPELLPESLLKPAPPPPEDGDDEAPAPQENAAR